MFRITEDPSSGSLVQCLAKNYKNDSIHVNRHDRIFLVILAKHCTRLHDNGSSVICNMLEQFLVFYNFKC